MPLHAFADLGNVPNESLQAALAANPSGARDALRLDGYADPRDYGTITLGTGATTEQKTANVAAYQAALDTRRNVRHPIGVIEINAPLVRATHGQRVEGVNQFLSILSQTENDTDAIQVRLDDESVIQGSDLIFGGVISNMSILGPGKAGTNGVGVDVSGSENFNGDWTEISRCYIRGFNKGIRIQGVGQAKILWNIITQNNYGIETNAGAQNSHQIIGNTIVNSIIGVAWKSGGGGVIQGGDYGNSSDCDIDIQGGGLQIVGGNFESTPRAVRVSAANASASINGAQFLRGGSSVAPIYVATSGKMLVINTAMAGQAATTPLVEKQTSTVVVQIVGSMSSATTMTGEGFQVQDSSQKTMATPFVSRYATSMASADVTRRGLIVHKIGAAGFYEDGIFFYGSNQAGAATIASMTPTITDNVFERVNTFSNAAFSLTGVPTHADNAAAVSAGLAAGRIYKTATGELRIRV